MTEKEMESRPKYLLRRVEVSSQSSKVKGGCRMVKSDRRMGNLRYQKADVKDCLENSRRTTTCAIKNKVCQKERTFER
jgi:hypothetical protein